MTQPERRGRVNEFEQVGYDAIHIESFRSVVLSVVLEHFECLNRQKTQCLFYLRESSEEEVFTDHIIQLIQILHARIDLTRKH